MFLVFLTVGVVISACMDADDMAEAAAAEAENLRRWRSATQEGPIREVPGTGLKFTLGSFPHLGQLWLTPEEATFFELKEDLDDEAVMVLRGILQDQANRVP